MIYLQATTPDALREAVPGISLQEARKIVGAIHRGDSLPRSVKMVRRAALESVRAIGVLPKLQFGSVCHSRIDPFVKYASVTPDCLVVETVRIPLEQPGRFSVCVSSQAGCGLACTFCATGRAGLRRNLAPWEIVEQVRTVRRGLDRSKGQRVRGVVFQGMGEPLANFENVLQAIRVLCEPSAQAIDSRAVTVCTAGIPLGVRRLAYEAPKVRVAISIGSARPEVRRALMPIDRTYPLERVIDATIEHACITGIAPMWAVTPLAGINDTEADARALAGHARRFVAATGLRPQISVIPYNQIDVPGQERFQRSGDDRESAFRRVLREEGFSSRKRYSGGGDIDAACGQLADRVHARRTSDL